MNTHAKRIGSGAFGAAVVYAAIHALMATPSSDHLAYSYSHIGDRAMIHASGSIGSHEEEAFNAWMASLPKEQQDSIRIGMTTHVLDSRGGIIEGATHMANWVRDNKIDTVVPMARSAPRRA